MKKKQLPHRVLAIALGEASWTCIRDPDFRKNLPFLTSMEAEGAHGTTLAAQPLSSPALWATVVTGRSGSAHGVSGSIRRDEQRVPRPVAPGDLAVPPIWRILENAKIPVGTFNVKFATPTPLDRPTGFMVSRDARPEIHPNLVYPPELYARLTGRFGQWATGTRARTQSDWESVVPREVETRKEVLLDLLQTRPWNFAFGESAGDWTRAASLLE